MMLPTVGQTHVSLATWHSRFGHASADLLCKMSQKSLVQGLNNVKAEKDFKCDSCGAANQRRISHPRSESRVARVCALLHTDLM
jgi:hypothetical protein